MLQTSIHQRYFLSQSLIHRTSTNRFCLAKIPTPYHATKKMTSKQQPNGPRGLKRMKWLAVSLWLPVIACLLVYHRYPHIIKRTKQPLHTSDTDNREVLLQSTAEQKLTRLVAENRFLKTQIVGMSLYHCSLPAYPSTICQ